MSDTTQHKEEFQAEVRQLLDIVINSLYTDKEIFVRELVSNASDALEKLQHLQLTEKDSFDPNLGLEINIITDDSAKTVTISDYGVGMTRDELVENLGTIAHSGSKQFLSSLAESDQKNSSLIGQFGVGFYSAFMVADEVSVYTHSWQDSGEHLCWTSDGRTGYTIEEAPGQRRGCKIVIKLKEEHHEFANAHRIKGLLETYSSFVPFPILLNGERVNTVEALWLKNKNEISDEEYTEFYKFAANAFDEPAYRMHFAADAPLAINALIFVPRENPEKFLTGLTPPGVSLYCRKILIDNSPKNLLPEWLRFLKGVIDSADLPLNISRESMQDSALLKKLNNVITKRFLKFLGSEAESDPEKYEEFYGKFHRFLKEGVAMDFEHRETLSNLLRYESSMTEKGKLTSLKQYVDRMTEGQESIYYLQVPDRAAAEAGPYLESFQARSLEVLFLFDPVDEYVVDSLNEYDGKKLVAVDRADLELGEVEAEGEPLSGKELESLCGWLTEKLGERVESVRSGERLVTSPAVALTPDDGMNAQVRQMMKSMNQEVPASKVVLEINPRHEIIHQLARGKSEHEGDATLVAEQLLDNALISAGLLEDSSDMVQRLQKLLGKVLP